ncbi:CAMK/CAMKL protein kinase [Allomyces macrogynus ATCC 38327]|uniref:CAMK/CAMKL protein kinase n=1 Tax=Allomyces macrogynus (strain ATCC 38327) TaxID=578462 RepID=A0A0L0SHS8_ALLM3|nr:CAMK/CAMKL protein kinase [Allomyces macrogynus ATCC 38327]|eukprot:KNE61997.1 CAMK/CAMKL protein kinase [Allomyces macrogynus ATCC 38327]
MAPPAPSAGPSTILPAAGNSTMPLTPDAVLKDFDMGRSLGSGKFSQVFLATSKSSQKKYAFKILSKVDHRPKVMEKLRREIDILHRLRGSRLLLPCPTSNGATHVHALQGHPNLVTLHRTFETVTSTILLLEYIPGINLHDFVFESIRLAEPVARGLFRQLVSAVSFCHARGVVHRDIKMGNAMLILCQPPKPPVARETGIAYPPASSNPNVPAQSPATPKHWPRRLELTRSNRLKFRSNIVAEPAGADAHAVATDPRTTCPATSSHQDRNTGGGMFAPAPTVAGRPWMAQEIAESGGWLVKLVDFGLGTGYDPDGYRHTAVGSPGYFSPEIARGAEYVGPEVDAWSLGVVLFEMTTGMHPFSAKDLATLKEIVIRGRYAVPPHVSPGLRWTLARLMNVDPRARKSLHMLDEDAWINAQYTESPVYADPEPGALGMFTAGRRVGEVFREADVDAVSCDNSSCDGGDEERRERRRRRRWATGVVAVLDDGIPMHEDLEEEDGDVEMAEAVAVLLSSAAVNAVAKPDKVGADADDASSTRAEPSRDSMEIADGDATLTPAPGAPMAIPRHEHASTAPGKPAASTAPTANQPSLPTVEVVGNDTTLTTAVLQEPWVTTSPAHDGIASVHHLATSAYNLLASGPGAAMYEYINVGRPRAATARSTATEPPPSLHEVDMADLPPVPTTAETQAAMAAAAAVAAALEVAKRDGAIVLQLATRSTPSTPSRRPARPPTGISKTPGPDRPRTRHHTHHAHERGMPCNAQCMRVARSRGGGRRAGAADPPVVAVDPDAAALAMAKADAAVRELQELRGLADNLRRYNPSMPQLVHGQAPQVPLGNEMPGSPVAPRRHGRSRRPRPEGGLYPTAGDAHAAAAAGAYPHQTAAAAEASAVPYNVSRPTTPARTSRQGSMHADPTAAVTHRPITPAPQLPETTVSCAPSMPTTPAPMALRMRNNAKPAAVAPPNAGGAAGPSASQQDHHAADRDRDRARWGRMPGWWNAQLQISDAPAVPPAGLKQHRGSAGTTATAETLVSSGAELGSVSSSSSSGSGNGASKPRWYKRLFSLGSSKDGGAAAATAAAAAAVSSTANNGNGRARARGSELKFSCVLLLPCFALLVSTRRIPTNHRTNPRFCIWLPPSGSVAVIFSFPAFSAQKWPFGRACIPTSCSPNLFLTAFMPLAARSLSFEYPPSLLSLARARCSTGLLPSNIIIIIIIIL